LNSVSFSLLSIWHKKDINAIIHKMYLHTTAGNTWTCWVSSWYSMLLSNSNHVQVIHFHFKLSFHLPPFKIGYITKSNEKSTWSVDGVSESSNQHGYSLNKFAWR
jgi:hypothetical protein